MEMFLREEKMNNKIFGSLDRFPIYFNGEIQYPVDGEKLKLESSFDKLMNLLSNKDDNEIITFENKFFSVRPYCDCCNCGTKNFRHEETCSKVLPNFHYKPTDFKLYWMEQPFNDCYANQPISINQINELFELSIKKIKV
jgi:hypothetical protein